MKKVSIYTSVLSMAPLLPLKTGQEVGWGHKGYSTTIMLVVDAKGKPLAVDIAYASQRKSMLAETMLAWCFVKGLPTRLTADKTYDCDTSDKKPQNLTSG
jgi:hypothetical protein